MHSYQKFLNFISNRKILLTLSISLLLIIAGTIGWVRYIAHNEIAKEQLKAAATGKVEVRSIKIVAPRMDGISLWLRNSDVRALIMFQGNIFTATSGGLLCYDESGKQKKSYTSADGLPENDLTSLSVFQDQLYIGTSNSGLLSFDGKIFTQHIFQKPLAKQISSLSTSPSYLLIGTRDGGLFDFDGATFSQRFQTDKGPKLESVTSIAVNESRVYIGTQNSGLFVWKEGELHQYVISDGLPSLHITSLLVSESNIYIATDLGVARILETSSIEKISDQPNITSLAEHEGKLWAGLITGGIVEISKIEAIPSTTSKRFNHNSFSPEHTETSRTNILNINDQLWALTEKGIFKIQFSLAKTIKWQQWGETLASQKQINSSHITSLAFDLEGKLWIGYFEKGVDLIDSVNGEVITSIQNERVREINFLHYVSETGQMLVATSAGLITYDSSLKERVYDEKSANLVSNSVSHILKLKGYTLDGGRLNISPGNLDAPLVLATGRGLTILQSGISRSLTAFHGLASNYLYCTEFLYGKLYVGSLGGLMELDGLRVAQTWKMDNSHLSANWISALLGINGTLFIGTYGGGVCALLPNGEIQFFEDTKGIEVNINAIATDGERLYIGTLDRGLLVYDLKHHSWRDWHIGLAGNNVTSIIVKDEYLYAGTTSGLTKIEIRRLAE